jgi:hypothetical protein
MAGTRRSSIAETVLSLGLVLVSGCQPQKCVETYSPIQKLLAGASIPTLFTISLAALVLAGIRAALGRASWPKGSLAVVAAACVSSGILALTWPRGLIGLWPALLVVLTVVSLRDHRPMPQSWMPSLSQTPSSSLGGKFVAGLLVVVLLLVTLVGSVFTVMFVHTAGQRCGPLPDPADPRSN